MAEKRIVKHWEDEAGFVKMALITIGGMFSILTGFMAAVYGYWVLLGLLPCIGILYCAFQLPNNRG